MNRRKFMLSAATGAAVGGVLAAPAVAQSTPKINWRLQSSYPKSLTTIFGGSQTIAEYVSALTDGNFAIQVFAGGEIVPFNQVIDAVQNNTVEMGHTISAYKQGADPTWALGTGLPFGLNARQMNGWFYYGGGVKLLDKFYEKNGVVGIPAGNTGCQMGGWWRKEVNTIDDLQGIKFRTSGLGGNILNRVGVLTQTLGAPDIYPALERGTIDAAEWIGPYDDEKLGFVEVAPYYYFPGWWENGLAFHAFVNHEQFQGLPKSYQDALRVACQAVNADVMASYDALNPAALKRLVSGGAKLRSFSKEILDRCYEEALSLYGEIGKENADFKEIQQSMWDFRYEQLQWWQVAEYSVDSFNVSTIRR